MTQPTSNANGNSAILQGRIVWTSGKTLFEGKHKTHQQTKALLYEEKTGNPIIEYGFGLAIPKIDPATNQFTAEYVKAYQLLHGEALTLYPSGQLPPGFAIKYKDGDGVDHEGKSFSGREGYANHIVVACTTRIPIKFAIWENGQNVLVNSGIKCGDYVNVQVNVKAHPAAGQARAGLYVNPNVVQLIQAGKEIINTPSADQVFGAAAPQYAGQVVAPTAPVMPMMGAPAPQMPMQPPMPGHAPQAPAYPAQPAMPQQPAYPQAPAQPPMHHDVLPQHFQPGHAPMPTNVGMQPPAHQQFPQAPTMPQTPAYPAQPAYPQAPAMPMMPPMPPR